MVQKQLNATPLGLFRFAAIEIDAVTAVLQAGFAGLGDPEFVHIRVSPRGEYIVHETRYGFSYHSFVHEGQKPAEMLHQRHCERLRFLADKLRDDLASGEKIFVWKQRTPRDAAKIGRLHRVLREHGRNTLLYVAPLARGRSVGDVEEIGDGLLRGHIDRFFDFSRGADAIMTASWIRICEEARRLREQGRLN